MYANHPQVIALQKQINEYEAILAKQLSENQQLETATHDIQNQIAAETVRKQQLTTQYQARVSENKQLGQKINDLKDQIIKSQQKEELVTKLSKEFSDGLSKVIANKAAQDLLKAQIDFENINKRATELEEKIKTLTEDSEQQSKVISDSQQKLNDAQISNIQHTQLNETIKENVSAANQQLAFEQSKNELLKSEYQQRLNILNKLIAFQESTQTVSVETSVDDTGSLDNIVDIVGEVINF